MKPLSDNKKAIIRVLLERMEKSQENEPDPKLEEMVKRSIEIGQNIEKQAEKMNSDMTAQSTEQGEQNAQS